MIALNTTLRRLEFVLSGAITSNQIPITVHSYTVRSDSANQGYNCEVNLSNSTTPVIIAIPPTSGQLKIVETVSVNNTDSADATVTIRYDDNSTEYQLIKVTLEPGDQLFYEYKRGWFVLDTNGAFKNNIANVATDAVGNILTDTSSIDFTYDGSGPTIEADVLPAGVDHNSLANVATGDVHTQYALLAGRSAGQTLIGSTAASGNLVVRATSNATKGHIALADEGGNVIIGGGATASRLRMLEASGSGTNYTEFVAQPQAGNITYTLPAADGSAGAPLTTNGSGTLAWAGLDWDTAWADAVHSHQSNGEGGTIDHGAAVTGLADDDHTQYALLAGRTTGQTIIGGTAASASITIQATSDAGNGDIIFKTDGSTEVARISATGRAGINQAPLTDATLSISGGISGNTKVLGLLATDAGEAAALYGNTNNSFASQTVDYWFTYAAASTGFGYMQAYSDQDGTPDTEYNLRGDGNAFCDGAFTGGGADYAEMFEWQDGNPANEDRRGMSVVLQGSKIRLAVGGDLTSDIIGVVSAKPGILADAGELKWEGRYDRDLYGSYVLEDYNIYDWDNMPVDSLGRKRPNYTTAQALKHGITIPGNARVTTKKRRKQSAAFDPTTPYIPRSRRKEWAAIGLVGKLYVRNGQPVGDRWKLMRAGVNTSLYLVR